MSAIQHVRHLPFTFLGLDFGMARMIGTHGFNNPAALPERLFYSWNLILHKEAAKYDVRGAWRVKNYRTHFDWNADRNKRVSLNGLVTNAPYFMDEATIRNYVQGYYDYIPGKGIGVTFIVESFNKLDENAYIWVTFFDIETKQVIFATRRTGRARGMGIRNYWANAVHSVILSLVNI